jgi:STE24 endopeptidase
MRDIAWQSIRPRILRATFFLFLSALALALVMGGSAGPAAAASLSATQEAGTDAEATATAAEAEALDGQGEDVIARESEAMVRQAEEPFEVEAATQAYMARLSPDQKARSDAYYEGGYWLLLWGFLYGIGVAWLLLGTGLSLRMRNLAERLTKRLPLQTALYAGQYVVVTAVLGFPLTLYTGFFREHQYELATQTFGPWMREQLVGLSVGIVIMPLVLVVLYGVLRHAPRTWWIWGAVVSIVLAAILILLGPVYMDPLFNTYEPLEDGPVNDSILSLARANGIDVDNVYQFDASRQSTRISANVSGFAGTMSIRLNDNLLNRMSLPAIEAVMAHEMGHFVLNHIYEMLIYLAVILLGGFAFLRWSFDWVLDRWGARWGIRGITDVAGLPLLVALLSLYMFVLTPVLNTIVRTNEAESDIFGLNAARQPDGFAEAALSLSEYRKLDPGPIEEWLFFDHPSGRARIHMAMQWKAEHLDELGARD